VILWATNEDVAGYTMRFHSSEAANQSDRPYLEVVWSQTLKTVYFLKDHLGSIRATVLDSTTAPVIGYDDYDPWGYPLALRTKPIPNAYLQGASKNKFTGHLFDDEYGINWIHTDPRSYMPDIGRWAIIDPLWLKHPDVTPYNYVLNNPLRFIDPDGMQVSALEMRFLRDPALRQGGTSQQDIQTAYQKGVQVGTAISAGVLAVGAAVAVTPYATAAALSNPVTTNEIGIAITEALSPGAESFLNAPSAIKGLTEGDLQRVFIGGESKAGRFTEALHNKSLAEGGSRVESLKSMKDGKFVFVKKLEDGSYEITVQTRAGGKTVDTQTTKGTAKELKLPNLDELYEQGAANHFIGKTKED